MRVFGGLTPRYFVASSYQFIFMCKRILNLLSVSPILSHTEDKTVRSISRILYVPNESSNPFLLHICFLWLGNWLLQEPFPNTVTTIRDRMLIISPPPQHSRKDKEEIIKISEVYRKTWYVIYVNIHFLVYRKAQPADLWVEQSPIKWYEQSLTCCVI